MHALSFPPSLPTFPLTTARTASPQDKGAQQALRSCQRPSPLFPVQSLWATGNALLVLFQTLPGPNQPHALQAQPANPQPCSQHESSQTFATPQRLPAPLAPVPVTSTSCWRLCKVDADGEEVTASKQGNIQSQSSKGTHRKYQEASGGPLVRSKYCSWMSDKFFTLTNQGPCPKTCCFLPEGDGGQLDYCLSAKAITHVPTLAVLACIVRSLTHSIRTHAILSLVIFFGVCFASAWCGEIPC